MGGPGQEWLNRVIGQPGSGEMRVVERQRQARNPGEQVTGSYRIGNERADVRLGTQLDVASMSLLDAPGQFIDSPGQRLFPGLLLKVHSGEDGDVPAAARLGVSECS